MPASLNIKGGSKITSSAVEIYFVDAELAYFRISLLHLKKNNNVTITLLTTEGKHAE